MKRDHSSDQQHEQAAGTPSAPQEDAPDIRDKRREKLQHEIEELQRELEQANDKYVRAYAEFDNVKKRLQRERDEFTRFASEAMVRQLLPIVDSLDQALLAVDESSDASGVIKGVRLIHRQLTGLLEKEGVQRIAAIGERFDPHRHEAVAQVDAGDGQPDNHVVEEVQVGYTMHGKVIRPAMVKVTRESRPQSIVHRPQSDEAEEQNADDHGNDTEQTKDTPKASA